MVLFDPSIGREYKGCRPALIIQAVEIEKSPLITIIPLTSKITKAYSSDVFFKKNKQNKLWKDSIALTRFVTSFDRTRFLNPDGSKPNVGADPRRIGAIDPFVMNQVEASVCVHLGLRHAHQSASPIQM